MYLERKFDFIRIIQIDGSFIYRHILKSKPLEIKNSKDAFHDYFSELLSFNLDLNHLNEIGKLKVETLLDEPYTYDLISVTFKYTDYKKGSDYTLSDIRKYLYEHGFVLNNKQYVRYKRSGGAARNGSCLFIRKPLYNVMTKWSNLKIKDGNKNIVSFEAYRALSLSGLIDAFSFNPKHILFVKDYKTILPKEEVARVYLDDGLQVKKDKCDIQNNIWDGEGLLDASIFDTLGYSKKGMLLLRNRFFKCCVFNTNLQEWFKSNNISSVEQLNGITFADKVEDIKMVVTESSLKYLKLVKGGFTRNNIKKWISLVSDEDEQSLFGIVKSDKPQRFFDGDMVETNYQLLNTIELTQQKTRSLLYWNIDYISKIRDIQNKPEYLKLYLQGESSSFIDRSLKDDSEDIDEEIADELFDESLYTFKKNVCNTLLNINRDVLKTSAFKYFVYDETVSNFFMRLYSGRVLVNGTFATLFGNPYELLLNIIGKFDGKSQFVHKDEICSSFFKDNEKVVGARSPHITMGNVYCVTNKRHAELESWFNLSREIVIVDAIENNIQQRLNGADYDSDSMLITNNEIIVEAAFKNYKDFLVPYCDIPSGDKANEGLSLAEIDDKIANNRVGVITNYSQLLNSYYWDKYRDKDPMLDRIYLQICKLAVLSGIEIDSAKRSFPFSTSDEISKLTEYLQSLNLIYCDNPRRPLFFYKITNSNIKIGYIDRYIKSNQSNRFKTTMDFVWDNVWNERILGDKFTESVSFSDLTNASIEKYRPSGKVYKNIDEIIEVLENIYHFWKDVDYKNISYETLERDFQLEIVRDIKKLRIHLNNLDTVRLLIKQLEKRQNKEGKEIERGRFSNLFLILFYLVCRLQKENTYAFLRSLFISNQPVYPLVRTSYRDDLDYSLFSKYGYEVDTSIK